MRPYKFVRNTREAKMISPKELITYPPRKELSMTSQVQKLAMSMAMSYDEFIGEMRKRGCSEPTALKIWNGAYEDFSDFKDNDVYLSNLRKAADVLKVRTGLLIP